MAFVSGILGLIAGSFLNVLIYRLNVESAPRFWQGRSLCPRCKHQLSWKDNVPLLSFVLLRGKCRYCRKTISYQYPLVEFATTAVFIFLGPSPLLWCLACVFIVIFFSDWIYGLIPDEMIVAGTVISLLIGQNILIGLLSGLGFLTIVLATKFKGMGLGDVKLAFLMGLLLGWPKTLVALWVAFVLGGISAIMLVVLKKKRLSATIALGPFLVLGVLVAALWSDFLLGLVLPYWN